MGILQYSYIIDKRMKFGLKLDNLLDKELLKICESTSASYLRMYNVIISYKYYLKDLSNDIAIFKRFNYFYLPRSITSTGRSFTIPYFLNLQNFIKDWSYHTSVTKNNQRFTKKGSKIFLSPLTLRLELFEIITHLQLMNLPYPI